MSCRTQHVEMCELPNIDTYMTHLITNKLCIAPASRHGEKAESFFKHTYQDQHTED